jgi:hypothetical protein
VASMASALGRCWRRAVAAFHMTSSGSFGSQARPAAAENVMTSFRPVGIFRAGDWRVRRLMGEGEADRMRR